MRGRFITFEGGEGAGKSTQVRQLAQRLRAGGQQVVLTREPGGSPGAEVIRHVILSGAAKPFGPDAEAILFAAARSDHVAGVIEPALASGKWVICDRFADSTRAYQGVLGEVDVRLIRCLERVAVGDTKPDLTIILDVPPQLGLSRASGRRGKARADRFESETLEFHTKLREVFRDLAEAESSRCVLIDGARDPDDVAEAIWAIVSERFHVPVAASQLAEVSA
jgi:dTMP kinase